MTSNQMTAGAVCVVVAAAVMMWIIQTSKQPSLSPDHAPPRGRVDHQRDASISSVARKPRWVLLEERNWVGATSNDLRQADRAMLEKLAEIKADRDEGKMTAVQYAAAIGDLRARELTLLEVIKTHVFNDEMESNYWHRGRLKFPDPIEEASRALDHTEGRH